MTIALIAVGLAVDLGQIIPNADQMPVPGLLEHREYVLVCQGGSTPQGNSAVAETFFVDDDGAEEQFITASIMNSSALLGCRAEVDFAPTGDTPYLAEPIGAAQRGRHARRHRDMDCIDVRRRLEAYDAENTGPPRRRQSCESIRSNIIEL
jgi:hypothetical protein